MGARRAGRLAPDQRSGVTIMDRFLGELKMDAPVRHVPVTNAPVTDGPLTAAPVADAPGGKAALASSRAKAAVLTALVLFGAYFYAAQETKYAAAAASSQALPREMRQTLAQLAAGNDDAAAVQVRRVFYDKQEGQYCGELNGGISPGGELRSKDGMRVIVCGPGLHGSGQPSP
jgi:hypothetical protein